MRKLLLLLLLIFGLFAATWLLGGDPDSMQLAAPPPAELRPANDPGVLDAPLPSGPTGAADERRAAVVEREQTPQVAGELPPVPTDPTDPEAILAAHPDPIERGECALFLEVYDRASLAPIATTVHLWRLDAPGNESWEAGAQRQVLLEVSAEGAWTFDLPAGRYRARCLAERRNSEDPAEFIVSGETTRHRIGIELPREREVLLQVFEADGTPISEVEFKLSMQGSSTRDVGRPSWATERKPKFEIQPFGYGMGGAWSGGRRQAWKSARADPDGWFHLGAVLEGHRSETPKYHLEARSGALAPLSYRFGGDDDPLQFVSVLIDAGPVQRSVVTPDGRHSGELEDELHVTSGAIPYQPNQVEPWRQVPIEGWRRWRDDYKDLEFEFTIDDLPLPTRVLTAKPAGD